MALCHLPPVDAAALERNDGLTGKRGRLAWLNQTNLTEYQVAGIGLLKIKRLQRPAHATKQEKMHDGEPRNRRHP